MSTSDGGEETEVKPVQSEIERVYRQYQQVHLYEALDDIAKEMERQLLQIRLANELLGTNIEIRDDTKQEVRTASENVGGDDLDAFEKQIEETRQRVEGERSRITNRIQERRVELHDTVEALTELNQEIGFIDAKKLDRLASFLNDWEWERRLDVDESEPVEKRLNDAETTATQLREIFEDATAALGDSFEGSEIQTLVDSLLSGEGMSLAELDHDQREALAESDLADHVALSLG